MKIGRTIERTITLTAEEVYAAVAAKYDLPPACDHVRLDVDASYSGQLVIIAGEATEQEL